MGGSLRRSKKTRPKVTIRKRTKGRLQGVRAKIPHEISDKRPSLSSKLGHIADWHTTSNTNTNYANHGFMTDANTGFGRNLGNKDVIQEKASEFDDINATVEVDDDFKQALGQQSSKGPAPPCKLTAHQTQIVKALIEAHADDVEGMVKDRKLNSMLLPASKLRQMLRSHAAFSERHGARCAFRVPNKRLW
ncbi:hypothetical protein ABBQ38_010063 [Trebouxia sp. C0009 RCD-2024]